MSEAGLDDAFVSVLRPDNQNGVAALVLRVRVDAVLQDGLQLAQVSVSSQGEDVHRRDINREICLIVHVLCEVPGARPAHVVLLYLRLFAARFSGVTAAGIDPVVEHAHGGLRAGYSARELGLQLEGLDASVGALLNHRPLLAMQEK